MAHEYKATIRWRRNGEPFTDRKYSRAHDWVLDGLTIPGSSSPAVVKLPLSRADAIDPEEALVAALSSCHMLFFLDFAAKEGLRIDDYRDDAIGEMGRTAAGKIAMTRVKLAPHIVFSGDKRPSPDEIARLHHRSHEECYIANSIKAEVEIAVIAPIYA